MHRCRYCRAWITWNTIRLLWEHNVTMSDHCGPPSYMRADPEPEVRTGSK